VVKRAFEQRCRLLCWWYGKQARIVHIAEGQSTLACEGKSFVFGF
jgi:hypothetical protein